MLKINTTIFIVYIEYLEVGYKIYINVFSS